MARTGRRIGLGAVLVLLAGGVYAGVQWKGLNARYSGYKLRTATTDEARLTAACRLIEAGDNGTPYLVETLRGGDAERCTAVVFALRDYLKDLAPDDARFAALCRPHVHGFADYSEVGQEAVVLLVPDFLRSPEPDCLPHCREIVRAALMPSATLIFGVIRTVYPASRICCAMVRCEARSSFSASCGSQQSP